MVRKVLPPMGDRHVQTVIRFCILCFLMHLDGSDFGIDDVDTDHLHEQLQL